ncbi:MAG: universal stress protein [Pseudomonadota bacterium]
MEGFKKILFPVDFSDCSKKVVPYAIDFARKFDAKLYFLFVVRDLSYLTVVNMPYSTLTEFSSEVAAGGEKMMDEFCDNFCADYQNYEAKVIIGDAPEEILTFTEKNGIDLIIIGTHGRKGLERILLGSVADYVIKNASVPVVTISPFSEAM